MKTLNEVSKELTKLGFEKGSIVETILVTRNPDGTLNPAPMGIVRIDSEILEIRPFKSSSTYHNLRLNPEAGVNVTNNPEIFYFTAFKKENEIPFSIDNIFSLNGSDATLIVNVIDVKDFSEDRALFTTRVRSVMINNPNPKVFSRGKAAAIEATIHATRIKELLKLGLIYDAEKLMVKVYECKDVIEKVSGSETPEKKVINGLLKMIKGWRDALSK